MRVSNTVPALLFVLPLCCATPARTADKHWSCRQHGGATKWGELDRSFATCKLGKVQSPIDIRDATPADLPAIKFDYKPSPFRGVASRYLANYLGWRWALDGRRIRTPEGLLRAALGIQLPPPSHTNANSA